MLSFPLEYTRGVTGDGFAIYCKNIWQKIVEDEEIDIPGERVLIGNFQCDKWKTSSFDDASKKIEDILKKQEEQQKKVYLVSVIEESLGTYCESARHHDETIFNQKKEELVGLISSKLKKELTIFLDKQLSEIIEEAAHTIKTYEEKDKDFSETTNLTDACNLLDKFTISLEEKQLKKFQALIEEFSSFIPKNESCIDIDLNDTQKVDYLKASLSWFVQHTKAQVCVRAVEKAERETCEAKREADKATREAEVSRVADPNNCLEALKKANSARCESENVALQLEKLRIQSAKHTEALKEITAALKRLESSPRPQTQKDIFGSLIQQAISLAGGLAAKNLF
eukprot:GHVP01006390.1.p1 GENE.GHVP01006390.1~~GHVP01006390.1.p1  ORF type:complete len:340 (-),score=80.64 GHVP01006390.1:379-1398(-)